MIKVVWSKQSLQELEDILEYWLKRNKSNAYPNKILKASDEAINLIRIHSNLGIKTNHRKVNMRLVLNRFYLVYRFNNEEIEILKFWDCRQSPKSNPFFK